MKIFSTKDGFKIYIIIFILLYYYINLSKIIKYINIYYGNVLYIYIYIVNFMLPLSLYNLSSLAPNTGRSTPLNSVQIYRSNRYNT